MDAKIPYYVFDNFERIDTARKLRNESRFSFLNRTAIPELAVLRDVIESWYRNFPQDGQADIRGRLRSSIEIQFDSAFYELALNAAFDQLGLSVALHPELASSTKRNDFVLDEPNGARTHLEAIVPQQSHVEIGTQARRDAFLEDFEKRFSELGYWLGITVLNVPRNSTSPKKFATFVETRIRSLDHSAVLARVQADGLQSAERFNYDEEGWLIEVSAYPKALAEEAGATTGPKIGMEMTPVHEIAISSTLLQGLEKKAKKYGEFDGPYIIAINSNDMFADQRDILDALFGREVIQLSHSDGHVSVLGSSRSWDGFWIKKAAPRNVQVSGVLYTTRVNPANLRSMTARLFLNPYAKYPYSGPLTAFPTSIPQDGRYEDRAGVAIADLLNVSNWLNPTAESESGESS